MCDDRINLPLSIGPPRSSSLRDSSSLKAWFLWRRPGVKPQIGLSAGRATSTSWVISAKRITSWARRAHLRRRLTGGGGAGVWGGTHQSFLVVAGLGIDTNDHSDFALSVKVVLEEMGELRVPVGHHLSKRTSVSCVVEQRCAAVIVIVPCLCHTAGSLEVPRCRCAESAETD